MRGTAINAAQRLCEREREYQGKGGLNTDGMYLWQLACVCRFFFGRGEAKNSWEATHCPSQSYNHDAKGRL